MLSAVSGPMPRTAKEFFAGAAVGSLPILAEAPAVAAREAAERT